MPPPGRRHSAPPQVCSSHSHPWHVKSIGINDVQSGISIAATFLRRDTEMPIAKITGQGLAAIALSVALLWACFIGERLLVRQTLEQKAQVMRELHQMQRDHRTEPVSSPTPQGVHRSRITVG